MAEEGNANDAAEEGSEGSAAAEQQSAAQQQAQNLLVQAMRGRGIQLDDSVTDDQFLDHVSGVLSRSKVLDEQFNAAQARLARLAAFEGKESELQEFLKAKEEAARKKDEPAPYSPPMKYDPEWEARTRFDPAQDRYIPNSPYDQLAADARNKYRQFERSINRRVIEDPWNFVMEAGGKRELETVRAEIAEVKKLIAERDKQAQTQTAEQQIRSIIEQNKDKLFERDGKDFVWVQAADGRQYPRMTEEGERFQALVAACQERGQDQLGAHQTAADLMWGPLANQRGAQKRRNRVDIARRSGSNLDSALADRRVIRSDEHQKPKGDKSGSSSTQAFKKAYQENLRKARDSEVA